MCSDVDDDKPSMHVLQTQGGDAQGHPRGKLDKEHIEGAEEGFVAVDVWILHLKVVHDVREH